MCHVQERECQLEDGEQPNGIFASVVTGVHKQVSVADREHNVMPRQCPPAEIVHTSSCHCGVNV